MATRQKDVKTWLLGTTVNKTDKTIKGAKLPTNKPVVVAFLARIEEDRLVNGKDGKALHIAAVSTVEEEIIPIYGKAKVITKSVATMIKDVRSLFNEYDKVRKTPKSTRDNPTGVVKDFKDKLKKQWCTKA